MPGVSVLVPSYEHSQFIERTLRSIFAQTLQPERLIVIDDGSKDESAAIIERVLKESPVPCEFFARENRGLSATLNEGFALSESEFFAYLGSDDVWLPEFLAEQVALLEHRPRAVLAFCHAYVIDEDDNIFDRTDNWTKFADGDLLDTLLRGEIFSSPGVVYRRGLLPERPWNQNAALEDYELYLSLAAGGEFARNERVLCAWRQHRSNTSDDAPLMLREQLAAQNRMRDKLSNKGIDIEKMQRRLRFHAAANHVRGGFRAEAFRLFFRDLLGAASIANVVGTALRLSVPRPLFEWNRRRGRKKAVAHYGKLDLGA